MFELDRTPLFSFQRSKDPCHPTHALTNCSAANRRIQYIDSAAVVKNTIGGRFYISFLPKGTYDLIFADLKNDGSINSVLGKITGVTVESLEDVFTCVQLTVPDVQGNCKQAEPLL